MGKLDAAGEKAFRPYGSGERVGPPLTWVEAWAIARVDLGLTEDEWLDMTPLQLYMLRQRYIEHLQYQEMLTGILAAATVNFSFCHPEKAVRPENFMLHPYELQEEPQKLPQKSQRVTAQTVLAAFKNFLPEDFSLEA